MSNIILNFKWQYNYVIIRHAYNIHEIRNLNNNLDKRYAPFKKQKKNKMVLRIHK